MKLIKLLPMVALLTAVSAPAYADIGKAAADDTNGKKCEKLVAGEIKKQDKKDSPAPAAAPAVRQELSPNSNTAM